VATTFKARLFEGEPIVNGWLHLPHGFAAELMAQARWDSLTVDLQHGAHDYASMLSCFQALAIRGVTPLARVPWNDPAWIGRVLDAGAQGIICPMVNTPEEAGRFVAAAQYPPLGSRSFGPIRAALYARTDPSYLVAANEDVVCLAQLETRQALDNLEAILETPGLDGLYIGPNDLAISLGYPPRLEREEPEIHAIYDQVIAAAGRHGRVVALHCDQPAYAKRMLARGFRLVTVGSDAGYISRGARATVAEMRTKEAN
jgi:4-hydroxy-2-oxoheptanedioate aldolase